jgi:pimeloyl-ACP methyl ester carboxylesterase
LVRAAGVVLCIAAFVAVGPVHAARRPAVPIDRCVPKGERTKAISFRTADGVRLSGVLLGTGKTGVTLSHESNATLCNWLPFARTLAKAGYRVLAFDSRSSGESQLVLPRSSLKATYLQRDVVAAAKLLRAKGSKRVVVAGASIGGTFSIIAAPAIGPSLAAVVSLSAPATEDALKAVAKVTVPTFFAAGRDDVDFAKDAQTLYDASPAAGRRVTIYPTGAHGTALLAGSQGVDARRALLDFIASAR